MPHVFVVNRANKNELVAVFEAGARPPGTKVVLSFLGGRRLEMGIECLVGEWGWQHRYLLSVDVSDLQDGMFSGPLRKPEPFEELKFHSLFRGDR